MSSLRESDLVDETFDDQTFDDQTFDDQTFDDQTFDDQLNLLRSVVREINQAVTISATLGIFAGPSAGPALRFLDAPDSAPGGTDLRTLLVESDQSPESLLPTHGLDLTRKDTPRRE